jgi:hypothetical protein
MCTHPTSPANPAADDLTPTTYSLGPRLPDESDDAPRLMRLWSQAQNADNPATIVIPPATYDQGATTLAWLGTPTHVRAAGATFKYHGKGVALFYGAPLGHESWNATAALPAIVGPGWWLGGRDWGISTPTGLVLQNLCNATITAPWITEFRRGVEISANAASCRHLRVTTSISRCSEGFAAAIINRGRCLNNIAIASPLGAYYADATAFPDDYARLCPTLVNLLAIADANQAKGWRLQGAIETAVPRQFNLCRLADGISIDLAPDYLEAPDGSGVIAAGGKGSRLRLHGPTWLPVAAAGPIFIDFLND